MASGTCDLSMAGSAGAVVAGTVGGSAGQPKHLRRGDGQRRRWFAASGEDVEGRGGADSFAECFGAGSLHGLEPVGRKPAEDVDHLAIAGRHSAEPALHAPHGGRQLPLLERRSAAQPAGLAGKRGDAVQRVVDGLVASEGAGRPADDLAILPELCLLGTGADLDRPADRTPSGCGRGGRGRPSLSSCAHRSRRPVRRGDRPLDGPLILLTSSRTGRLRRDRS